MNRLQKRCLLASATTHGLLFAVLLVSPAFLSHHNPADDLPPLEMVPDRLIDEALFGGGGQPAPPPTPPPPAITPPPQTTPPPTPAPEPPLAKTEPPPPEPTPPRPTPTPPKPKPDPDPETVPQKVVNQPPKPTKPPEKRPVKVNLQLAQRSNTEANREAERQAQARAQAERQAQADRRARAARDVEDTLGNLRRGLSTTGMSVEMPGPGGESYANYRQFVKSVYQAAWTPPESVTDENATVTVRITIARDGTVKRTEILSRSGLPSLDKSVRATLDRVRSIGHPFPEGAKEDEREFRLNFNLKSKRSTG